MSSLGKNRIFWIVLLAHLLALTVLILVTSTRSKKFYANPATSVDLVEPVELSAVPEEAAPEEPPPVEPPPPPEEPKPAPLKKITKKAPSISLPPSDLKKRLEAKLAEVKTESPRRTTARKASTTGKERSPWYINYISGKMHGLWKQPAKATVGKDEATALVSFRVYRDGHIEAIKLEESSGSRVMDESVLHAVRMADPLDPPPAGFIKGRYENLDILFELSD